MTLKRNNTTHAYFWGCSSFPACSGSKNLQQNVSNTNVDFHIVCEDGSEVYENYYDEGHPFTDYMD